MSSFPRGFLVLAMVLVTAAASQDTRERQKEREAVGLAPKLLRQDAADSIPEIPENFEAFPQSSTTVMVVWDRPPSGADVDYYLVYVQDEDMESMTAVFYYIWEDLEPCKTYTFGVRAVATTGNTSEPALCEGTTLTETPPAPQNLRVEDYTHTAATLTWEKPDTYCDIDYYRVKYREEESIQVTGTTVVVSDLLPETEYTFTVNAATSEGEGPAATVTLTTAPDPGGPPEDLVAEGISPSAINVSWSAPNKEPDYYLVSATPCMYSEEVVYELMYVIKDLDPCRLCYVTVTSVYNDLGNKFNETTQGETKSDAPPPPDSCSVEVNENFITVNWEKPTTICGLGPYDVTWTWQKLWGDGEQQSDTSSTTAQSYIVDSPPPYHNYTFEVAASVDGVFGSPTFCSGTSLESPAGPPVILSVVSEEAGVAEVTWDSPAEENGEILQYGIFVNDAADPTKNVSGEVRSTTLSLQECVIFNFSVEAANHAGWGERSEAKDVMVIGDVLPEELRCMEPDPELQVCWEPYSAICQGSQYNLKWEGDVLWSDSTDSGNTVLEWSENEICYKIPSTPYTSYNVELSVGTKLNETITCSVATPMAAPGPPTLEELQSSGRVINVTWKEPEEKNGVISGYQVKWTDWNGGENLNTTDGNTFSLQIVESSCDGEVDVTVRAKTTDVEEFGEESAPRSAFLVNWVLNLTCDPTEPGVIELAWEVKYSECPVEEYNATWTFVSLWSEDTGSGWESVAGNDVSALVTSLPPYSSVSVEVHLDNAPEDASCTATTLEEIPSAPTQLQQTGTGIQSVFVEWSLPEFLRGRLEGWYLYWTTAIGQFVDEHDIENPDERTFEIESLEPSEVYYVYVMAVNGAGRGEVAVVEVTTEYVPSFRLPRWLWSAGWRDFLRHLFLEESNPRADVLSH